MHLNCHSCFSLRYGTLKIKELLHEAAERNIRTLALTDVNNTSGCLEFIREAPNYGIRPVVGIDFRQGARPCYLMLARNNAGFEAINRHLSSHLHEGSLPGNRAPQLPETAVIYRFGMVAPEVPLHANEYIGVRPEDLNRLRLSEWRKQLDKLVICQPTTFRNKKDFNAHRLLRAIDNNTLLSMLSVGEQASEHDRWYSEQELENAFVDYPEVVANTRELLESCGIEFTFGETKNKRIMGPSHAEDKALLRQLTYEGLYYRYSSSPGKEIFERVEKELEVINRLGFTAYFLINWDIVQYARQRDYFYVGRGSGANSVVAYCLRITDVDPIDLDLYFERFINLYRKNPPDFDIDFSWKDRDDITAYIFERHGREHTALLATYNTFKAKSVIRELGKVFGLPKGEIDQLVANRKSPGTPDQIANLVQKYSSYIQDLPSHLSIHAGGILISEKPIYAFTATNLPPKGYPLTQFSMIEAEDVGLYKYDILSQRGLGHIRDSIQIVQENRGETIDIHNIAGFKEDPVIKSHLRTGRTMGCFYVESPAMRMLLTKLHADTYLGLVAASSVIRPGVAQSGMMREYVLRFRDPERRKQAHPVMIELMPETYGIMVYQEDVIKVAHYFAGLGLSEADVLRRGMSGKFRSRDEFQQVKEQFFSNCKEKGYPEQTTSDIWHQIESFAGYSFSKGHSASYAVESYQSLYLKAHYPLEFMVGVINNFGGFYHTEFYVHEARMCGASVLPPCVNHSRYLTHIEGTDVYLGFVHMSDLERKTVERLALARQEGGPFTDLPDFMRRVDIAVEQLRLLVRIGAFRFSGRTKKELLWDVHMVLGAERKTRPGKELFQVGHREFKLPELNYHSYEDAMDEIEILGFPLCSPFHLLRERKFSSVRAGDLRGRTGQRVVIEGYLVTVKNTRTVKGDQMHFAAFLDVDGHFFDTVHFPPSAKAFPFRGRGIYRLSGRVAEEFEFPSIEVERMERMPMINRED